jgi:tetratricopeptide (TPR) repeat protein
MGQTAHGKMSGQIFISYRRDDASYPAGRLYDRLLARLPNNHIFFDVDLEPGIDFVEAIKASVASCEVLIAVIGKRWLVSSDEEGKRRLDSPDDFVRIEIATALKRNIRVIPVLVDGALMPRSNDLPDDLKLLVRRNAVEVSHSGFNADFGRLVTAIEKVLQKAEAEHKRPEKKERLEAQRHENEEKQKLKGKRRGGVEGEQFELDPRKEDAVDAFNRGNAYVAKSEYGKGISAFTEAIRLEPNYASAYSGRGLAYINAGINCPEAKIDWDKVISDFTEAIRLKPDEISSYRMRALAYFEKNDYDRAIRDFANLIRLKPDDRDTYFNRGSTYMRMKEYDNAVRDYSEAIRLNPNFALAYKNRGVAYESQGKLDEAKADIAKADELERARQKSHASLNP